MKKYLPATVKTTISYEGIKLLSQFPIKDKTKFEQQLNLFFLENVQMLTVRIHM